MKKHARSASKTEDFLPGDGPDDAEALLFGRRAARAKERRAAAASQPKPGARPEDGPDGAPAVAHDPLRGLHELAEASANALDPCGLPAAFVSRLKDALGHAQADAVVSAMSRDERVSVRVNTLMWTVDEALASLAEAGLSPERVDGLPEALTLPYAERDALTHHAGSEDGRLYVQDLASQWSAHALDAQPGETILDLAAAPGGKTGFIAARMANTGSLSAVEPVRDRFFRMTQNLKRLGVTNVKFYMKDGRTVGRLVAGRFDRVMLDAPCSSEARFDPRDPGSFSHWSERKVQEVSRKQRALILSGFEALRPGGLMVYSTCSYAPEENEAVVAHLLSQVGGQAELLPLDLPGAVAIEGLTRWADEPFPEALRQTRRLLPAGASHGFYIARIRKAVQG